MNYLGSRYCFSMNSSNLNDNRAELRQKFNEGLVGANVSTVFRMLTSAKYWAPSIVVNAICRKARHASSYSGSVFGNLWRLERAECCKALRRCGIKPLCRLSVGVPLIRHFLASLAYCWIKKCRLRNIYEHPTQIWQILPRPGFHTLSGPVFLLDGLQGACDGACDHQE